jgi:hypothetical protein
VGGGVAGAAEGQPVFEVSRFEVVYGLEHPELPPAEELARVDVPLGISGNVFVSATDPGATPTSISLAAVPPGARFSLPALVAIMERIVSELNRRELQMVFVRPDSRQVNLAESTDLRGADDRSLRLIVWVGQVAEVRTIAKGERFPPESSINHPAHARIRGDSPVQPTGLFRRRLVDNYVNALSAHPTRRVEASLASAGEPGKVVLDFLVNEVRPWQLFAQVSNTGNPATGEWRTRLGFQHTQLTNHDDILNLDVVSSGAWETRAGLVSYSYPLLRPDVMRLRVFGSAGDFKIDDLGFQQTRFTGDNWQVGAEIVYRFPVREGLAVTAQTGIAYNHYEVGSSIANASAANGRSGFLIPYVGGRASRTWGPVGLSLAARLEHSVSGVPNESPTNGIDQLGRSEVAPSWTALKGGFVTSSHLDALFARARPGVDPGESLAHEISFSLRGQYVLSRDRLVPQEQDLVGGAYSVRGYRDAVVSADDSLVASMEYTFHAGRVFALPRIAGATAGLLVRAFTDYGRAWLTPPSGGTSVRPSEQDRSLWSAGVGTEITLRNRITLRCDVGYVLRELKDPFTVLAERGDIRAHFLGGFTW